MRGVGGHRRLQNRSLPLPKLIAVAADLAR